MCSLLEAREAEQQCALTQLSKKKNETSWVCCSSLSDCHSLLSTNTLCQVRGSNISWLCEKCKASTYFPRWKGEGWAGQHSARKYEGLKIHRYTSCTLLRNAIQQITSTVTNVFCPQTGNCGLVLNISCFKSRFKSNSNNMLCVSCPQRTVCVDYKHRLKARTTVY